MKPQVLILNEPTAGLDPGSHKEVLQLIRNVHEKQNNIIVFVSHDMADIAEMSDKVIVMDRGKLIMLGTPEEIFSKKERLDAIALNVPPVTDMMYRIKERGIDIGTDVLTLKDTEEALYTYLRGNDYYQLQNIQADTAMRESIAKDKKPAGDTVISE